MEVKTLVQNVKCQCSGALKETQELFEKLGLQKPTTDFFIVDDSYNIIPVNPSVYKYIDLEELSVATLKEQYELQKKCSTVYKPGTIVAIQSALNEKAVAIVLEDQGDFIKAYGQDFSGEIYDDSQSFGKRRMRKANASEVSHLMKKLSEAGFHTNLIDGLFDLFNLRLYAQEYWAVDIDFVHGKTCAQYEDTWEKFDSINYANGNYFKTEQDAIAALKKFVG